jgi:hypothetical protein
MAAAPQWTLGHQRADNTWAARGRPGPTPQQPTPKPIQKVGDIVQLGLEPYDGPTWIYANTQLKYEWKRRGGDWRDADGVENGRSHYAAQPQPHPFAGVRVDFDVAVLIKKLLVQNTGFFMGTSASRPAYYHDSKSATPPRLKVVTSDGEFEPALLIDGYWSSSSNKTKPHDGTARNSFPGALKFDLSGVTGEVKSATLRITGLSSFQSGKMLYVDYLDMPALIHDPARQLGGVKLGLADAVGNEALATHPSVIFRPSFASMENIKAEWPVDERTLMEPTKFADGASAVKLTSVGIPTLISWRKYFKGKGYRKLFGRYRLKVHQNLWEGMNERGVKLPGFSASSDNNVKANYRWSYRMEHLKRSYANPYAFRLMLHAYDADNLPGVGSAENRPTKTCLMLEREYTVEQFLELNTRTPEGKHLADGKTIIWVDGVEVYRDETRMINDDLAEQPEEIGSFFANILHGGRTAPRSAISYTFGDVVVATEYIGPAKR